MKCAVSIWCFLVALFCITTPCLPAIAQGTFRQRQSLDTCWRFRLGDPTDITNAAETNVTYYPEISYLPKLQAGEVSGTDSEGYMETLRADPVSTHLGENVSVVQTNYNDSAWRFLNLPHDWAVELPFDSSAAQNHGYKLGIYDGSTSTNAIGWYRRTFSIPANYAGLTLWLEFDGVYRNCLVWLNGHILGRNVSGYSSFSYDISKYANPGATNVLVLRVDASRLEGWFYEGAGIYRHVWLVETAPVHVAHWGTYVSSTVINTNAMVSVQTQVNNDNTNSMAFCSLVSTILDANSNVEATATQSLSVPAGSNLVVTQTLSITNVLLWSLQSPNLYQLVSTVMQGGVTNDVYQTPFGVRTVQFDPNYGLFLNGQRVPIQGMCSHQDHAGVGSALPDRLQYYRVERLKEMGCNVYRTSHNPPTPELLNACDQLGMLVLDENRRIGTNAEPLAELQGHILRDRNHPSVFCWSLANEEDLQQDNITGAPIMQIMVNLVHQLDPSRKCTAAMNGWSDGAATGFSLAVDVQGFNYLNNGSMDGFHNGNPNMPEFGTEEASTYYTRGIYSNTSTYDSAYDVNTPGYGSSAEGWWQYYTKRPWASGACVWTGFDYRGEPSPFNWPNISSEFGCLDTCGFPKDVFYYYQANWTLKPVLHLLPHWNWSTPGQPIDIWAFGNCQVVELFVNGVSQGRQILNIQSHVEWAKVPYTPGTLQAIGYNNGVAVITNTVVTTGMPAAIALIPDRSTILADGSDVSVVTVAVLDAAGNLVPTASNTVTFAVSGGAIIGVGNGNPISHESDKASQRSVFNGLAQVIIQSTNLAGPITLAATSVGLTSTNITITGVATLPPPVAPAGVTAVGGNAQVAVSWDIVPGVTAYNIWRSTTSGGPYQLIAGNISGQNLGVTDNDVTNLTAYYYVVTANGNGTSANSAEVSATPDKYVTGLTAMAANGQIVLNWNVVPGAKYNLKRATVSGGSYSTIASSISKTNYTDASVVSCQDYYYVVTITNAGYESKPSAEAVGSLPGELPSPWLNADIGSVGVAGSATYCNGQFTVAGSGGDIWGTADAFQFVYVYLPSGTNIDLRARVETMQTTASNAKAAVMIRQSLAANSPHALADVEPSSGIELLWRTNTGGATYSTVIAGESAPNWVRLARVNNVFSAYWSPDGITWNQIGIATNLSMTTGIYAGLAVCAHNNAALNTSQIDNVSANFLQTSAPATLQAVVGYGLINLQWTASAGATSYNVKRSTLSGAETLIATTTATNYTDLGLSDGVAYYYVVSAQNLAGPSGNSSEVAAAPLTPVTGSFEYAIITNHPLAYWPLSETSGSVAYDMIGGHNGTYVGGVTLDQPGMSVPGLVMPHSSVLLDGTSGYVDIPEGPFNLTNAMSAIAWVRLPAASHFSDLIGHGDSSWRMSVNPAGEPGGADGGGSGDAMSATSIVNTGWHMVAFTYTGVSNLTNNGSLYVDGVLAANDTISTPPGNNLDVWIGGAPDYGTGRLLPGNLAQVAVFANSFTAAQVRALYNTSLAAPVIPLRMAPTGTGSFVLQWFPGGLLQATNLAGPWLTNSATSPYQIIPTNSQMYFKLQ
jgi:beta-galactosidase